MWTKESEEERNYKHPRKNNLENMSLMWNIKYLKYFPDLIIFISIPLLIYPLKSDE